MRAMDGRSRVDPGVRAALLMAQANGESVVVTLQGDPARNRPGRVLEGVPAGIVMAPDGRERLILTIASEGATEQIILLERVATVAAVPA